MSDQAKFQKMLEVLLLLDCQYGRTITELSERFEISQRTVYRYLDTFKQVGFVIENTNGYFKIDKENATVQEISHLLHFSEEEAFILSKAIHSIEDTDEFKSKLVKKLYSLYDFDRVIHAISKKEESENIYTLLQAIKQQKQVVLQSYKSGNSKNIRDRIVEPIDFTINYTGVWCYDTEDGVNKVFKASRIKHVQLLESFYNYKPKHKKGIIDIFRMQSFEPIAIILELSLVAYNLIIEEYPLSEKYISKVTDNLYRLECEVGNFLGVGRFVLGLPGEIQIIASEALKQYVLERHQLFSTY
jgi:predicted DNA-binding transcriptional regulator YafY